MFHDHFALSATEKSMHWFFLNIQGPDLNSIPLLLAGFFFGWPGSTHLTRDPVIRPGRPPGRVSKLWILGLMTWNNFGWLIVLG
jgi:hypothetical protein